MAAIVQIITLVVAFSAFSAFSSVLPVRTVTSSAVEQTVSGFPTFSPKNSAIVLQMAVSDTLNTDTACETSLMHVSVVTPTPVACASRHTHGRQSSWDSNLISTVIFGCIASILSILAIVATLWLGHRQLKCVMRNSIEQVEMQYQNMPFDDVTAGVSPYHGSYPNRAKAHNPSHPAHRPLGRSLQDIDGVEDDMAFLEVPPPVYSPPDV